ncbi:MAG: DUF402 domain-containing protein [Flexilinea sp.]|nr:DUF402 domain-containing protein [Flexilinea sp.]
MNIKTIRRDDWYRVLEKQVIIQDFCWKGIPGKISLMKINKVSSPLSIDYGSAQVKIVDAGYSWVQIALEGQFFWITSMFDENDRLVEIYIDMTDGNVTDVDDPYFADLYLDYVVHVQEDSVMELDRDELTQAYHSGAITRLQYERTLTEGEKMLCYLNEERQELMDILVREQARLSRKLV